MIRTLLIVYLSLAECLSLGESNDPSMKNARLDVLMAGEQQAAARWEFAPRLSANAGAFHSLRPMLKIDATDLLGTGEYARELANRITEQAYMYGINPYFSIMNHGYSTMALAMQPIYAGGRIVNGNRLSDVALEASRLQLSVKSRETAAAIEEKYFLIVSLQEKEHTLEEAGKLLESVEKDVESAIAAGVACESDLLQVRMKIKELEGGAVKLRGAVKLAKMDLFNAIGYEYSYLGLGNIVLSDSPYEERTPLDLAVPQEEVVRTAESRLLELQVEGARLQKKMAVGEYLPQVAIGAGYGYGNMTGLAHNDKTNAVAFATVQIPITDIAKAVHAGKKYACQVEKARNEQEYYEAQLVLQLRSFQLEMETAWDEVGIRNEALNVALDAEKRIRANFNAGMVPVSEVMEVELSLQTAREDLLNAQIAYKKASLAYLRRCGKL